MATPFSFEVHNSTQDIYYEVEEIEESASKKEKLTIIERFKSWLKKFLDYFKP